jgi:mannose-6-phosphate isomerase
MMPTAAQRPHRLGDNRVPVYYAGGEGINRFRGDTRGRGPEDWIASVAALPAALLPPGADPDSGVSHLEDGTSLRTAIHNDPEGWLGAELRSIFGENPALLTKLLDAGERLPVHCHPGREFAREHLDSIFGKTEGWIVMDGRPGAEIWLGFRENINGTRLRRWIDEQDSAAMLNAMNRFAVRPGDVFYVPAGTPHAIGPGVMITELQEPTSFSILAEFAQFGLDARQATLGLGWDVALRCFDRQIYRGKGIDRLRPRPSVVTSSGEGEVTSLFQHETTAFFRAYRARAAGDLPLGFHGFCVAIVERGSGHLRFNGGTVEIARGQTWVVPHAAGSLSVRGRAEIIFCLPPEAGLR